MKKTLKAMALLLLVVMTATFTSCTKPEQEEETNDDEIYYPLYEINRLVGKWKCVQTNDPGDLKVGDIFEFKTGGVLLWTNTLFI